MKTIKRGDPISIEMGNTPDGEPVDPKDCIQMFEKRIRILSNRRTNDNAHYVCRASMHCFLSLIGQGVYGPTRVKQETHSEFISQLERAIVLVDSIKVKGNSRHTSIELKKKSKSHAILSWRLNMARILKERGVSAVNSYLEKRL